MNTTKLNGKAPIHGHNATPADLITLFDNPDRHPNALRYELNRAPMETIRSLAYGEFAPTPIANVPDELASMAYDEIERRDVALSRLMQAMRRWA